MAGDDSLTHKEYCPVCHNFEPTGLVAERDQGVRDQYGPGRLALEGREPKEFENSKCEDCNLLLQAANELSQHKWEWLAIWLEKGNNPRVSLDSSEHGNVSFELYSPDESYGRMPSLPEIPPGPECPESIQFINERMNDCREHPSCRPPQFVPKRLYQISKSRIIEPESYVPYCALSYCWGKALTLKTTTTNHDRFKEWMDHREFPVCFTDASTVAQRLNVDYICR